MSNFQDEQKYFGSSQAGSVTKGAGRPENCGQYHPDVLEFMHEVIFSVFPSENFVDLGLYQFVWEQCDSYHSSSPAARTITSFTTAYPTPTHY
ncbi:hypothetical protein [Bacteroides congonensis]|uniref:hypothetical protein n=1 Tax=Bacteroides congonensis TaxID=1871006 RepID=UPI00321A9D97